MAVVLRFARRGSKKRPYYWCVAADKRAPRDGKFLEKLGTYNPLLSKDDPNRTTFVAERVQYWLDNGAKPSDTVHRLLHKAGVVSTKPSHPTVPKKSKKKADVQADAADTAGDAA